MNLGLEANTAKNASRQYKISINSASTSAQKLSSGYRINSAADDAAGLSISEKMRKQIRGLNQASDNISDGVSYVQVADGALSEVQLMMHRMSELSIQASNDTNTAADRLSIDQEIQALKKEINRIFQETEFNTKKIWDTNTNARVQIGTEQVSAVTSLNFSSQTFQITEENKWTLPKSTNSTSDYGYYDLIANETDGVRVSWTAYNGKTYTTDWIEWPDELNNTDIGTTLQIPINSSTLDMTTYPELTGTDFTLSCDIAATATVTDAVESLNNIHIQSHPQQSTSATITTTSGNTTSVISKTFSDGSTLSASFSPTILYQALLASDRSFNTSTPDFAVSSPLPSGGSSFTNAATDTDKWSSNFTFGTGSTNSLASATNNGTFEVNAVSTGVYHAATNATQQSNYWWYYNSHHIKTSYGFQSIPNLDGSTIGTLGHLNNTLTEDGNTLHSTTLGGSIQVRYSLTGTYDMPNIKSNNSDLDTFASTSTTGNVGNMTMTIGGVTTSTTKEQIQELLDQIANVDIDHYTGGYNNVFRWYSRDKKIDSPIYEAQINLKIQTSDMAFDHIDIAYSSLRLQNLGLADTNVTTYDDAQKAIAEVSNALDMVSEQRSLFGAYQNRLISAQSIANNSGENVQAAESMLRDANMATEMMNYTKHQLLSQTGEAVLSQANSKIEQVLALLQ